MATMWVARRPRVWMCGSWDGDNLAELQAAFPTWTFVVNPDGSLRGRNGYEFDHDVQVGQWFTSETIYDSEPTQTEEMQAAPAGLSTYDMTAE